MKRLIVSLSMWLLLISPLSAQESYRDFERGLNLSPEQRAHIDGINRRYIGAWRTLKDESVRRRYELRELNRERPDGRERAIQLEREIDQIDANRHRLYRQYKGEVSTIFSEEQRGRYNAFCEREGRRPLGPPRYRRYGR